MTERNSASTDRNLCERKCCSGQQSYRSAAGNAHVPAYARPIVAAVNNEVMAFRLEPDGAVDRGAQQLVVG